MKNMLSFFWILLSSVLFTIDAFPMNSPEDLPIIMARELLEQDSLAHFNTAERQHYIFKEDWKYLNEKGKNLLTVVSDRVKNEDYNDTIIIDHFIPFPLIWIPETSHPQYPNGKHTATNDTQNFAIIAISQITHKRYQTNSVIFYADNWYFTQAGFLYKIVNQK